MNDITVDKNTQWTPIGTEAHRFKGIFDGNGKTITGLTYTDTSVNYVGLVGYADDATIQDVTVQGSSFNGNDYIGTVCGFIVGGTITGCTNSGSTVSGSWKIGGIAGKAKYTNVQRCVNTGKVSGKNDLGGHCRMYRRCKGAGLRQYRQCKANRDWQILRRHCRKRPWFITHS